MTIGISLLGIGANHDNANIKELNPFLYTSD
jgi:hypothetical protein